MDPKIIKLLEQMLVNDQQLPILSLIDDKKELTAHFIARTSGIVSGIDVVKTLFNHINPKIKFIILKDNGMAVNRGTVIAYLSGKMKDIMRGKSLALALLQTMSGIASLTNKYVREIHSLECDICDFCESSLLPLSLAHRAIIDGGGKIIMNEGFIINDYHIHTFGNIKKAINLIMANNPKSHPVTILVSNQSEFLESKDSSCDNIILHKMSFEQIKNLSIQSYRQLLGIKVNSSLGKVRTYALTGVRYIVIDIINMAKMLDIDLVYTKIA